MDNQDFEEKVGRDHHLIARDKDACQLDQMTVRDRDCVCELMSRECAPLLKNVGNLRRAPIEWLRAPERISYAQPPISDNAFRRYQPRLKQTRAGPHFFGFASLQSCKLILCSHIRRTRGLRERTIFQSSRVNPR